MVDVTIPTVKNFLFCISLRNGVKLLGWMFLVGHVIAAFGTPFKNLRTYIRCTEIPLYEDPDTGSHVCPKWLNLELLAIVVADYTLSLVQLVTTFLLLMGVYQTKPRLIIQWVVLQIFLILISLGLNQLSFLRNDPNARPGDLQLFYTIYVTWLCVEVYGIYISYCYYMSVISDPNQVV